MQNHPKSKAFFKHDQTEVQEIQSSLFYCCPECSYKSKDVNQFQIHALEKHPQSMSFFTRENINENQGKYRFCNVKDSSG